jgi:hypothetical protein
LEVRSIGKSVLEVGSDEPGSESLELKRTPRATDGSSTGDVGIVAAEEGENREDVTQKRAELVVDTPFWY